MRRLFLIWMAVLPLLTYAVTPLENLKIAADGGIADAQYDLAVLYETGEQGLKKSTKQAYYWYEKAAKGGNEKAKAWLAKVTKKSDQQRVEQARVEKAAQDKRAIESIEQDPFVRDLVEQFDAKVIESSIKPL